MSSPYTVVGFLGSNESTWTRYVRADNADAAIPAAIREYCQHMSESPDNLLVVAVIPGAGSNAATQLGATIKSGSNFVDDVDMDVDDCEEREVREAHAENRLGNPGVNY